MTTPPVRLLAASCLCMLALATACTQTVGTPEATQIGAPEPLLADLVREIGGEHIEVTGDPDEAAVIFVNGLGRDPGPLPDGLEVVAVGDLAVTGSDVLPFPGTDPSAVPPVPNPAALLHPAGARAYADVIVQTLARLEPEHAQDFHESFELLERRLLAVEEAAVASGATVARPVLMSFQSELAYAVTSIGWRFEFLEPLDGSLGRVDAIAARARAEDVRAVFGPDTVPDAVRERLERRAGVEYVEELRFDVAPRSGGLARALQRLYATFIDASGGDVRPLTRLDLGAIGIDPA